MKIVFQYIDKERSTHYFDIEEISNWDLALLWRLLRAEKERANCVNGFFRGSQGLLEELDKLAEQRGWKIGQ